MNIIRRLYRKLTKPVHLYAVNTCLGKQLLIVHPAMPRRQRLAILRLYRAFGAVIMRVECDQLRKL
mgnify:CR=1 FL=1